MSPSGVPPTSPIKVRVWDLPLRLFHWGLVVAVVGTFACAWVPGVPIEWHVRFGLAVLALLLFRLAWGLAGGHWARFSRLRPTPTRIRAYLRGSAPLEDRVGHSPLGALGTIALLTILALQVGSGLLADDEIAFVGPLNHLVSSATGLAATGWHKHLGKLLVIVLITLHVGAIAYYLRVRKENLVAPMLHGDKEVAQAVPASRDDLLLRLWALLLAALAGAAVWLLM